MSTQPTDDISAWLDGELTDAEREQFEARLAADPALEAEVDAIRSATELLRSHGPVRAPAGFQARVLDAVADEPMPGAWWRWLRRPFGAPLEGWAVAAAAAAVLFFLARPDATAPEALTEPEAGDITVPAAHGIFGNERKRVDANQSSQKKRRPTTKKSKPTNKARGGSGTADPTSTAPDADPPGTPVGSGATKPAATPRGTSSAPSYQPIAQSARGYRITTDDPEFLRRLKRIAGRNQGTVTDGRQEVKAAQITPGRHQYYVVLPTKALDEFYGQLEREGRVERLETQRFESGDTMQILVEVVHEAGSGPPKARMLEAY